MSPSVFSLLAQCGIRRPNEICAKDMRCISCCKSGKSELPVEQAFSSLVMVMSNSDDADGSQHYHGSTYHYDMERMAVATCSLLAIWTIRLCVITQISTKYSVEDFDGDQSTARA